MAKIRVGVIFGGRSAEHEVSIVSGRSVMDALDKKKFEVVPIGITKVGEWIIAPDAADQLLDRADKPLLEGVSDTFAMPLAEVNPLTGTALVSQKTDDGSHTRIDVLFPVLHGAYGEDGTIQGLLEMLGLPYVGAGVLGSALGMDKVAAKSVWSAHELPLVPHAIVYQSDWSTNQDKVQEEVRESIGFPCFVKPSSQGSSIGISKVREEKELESALKLAFEFDSKVLVEQGVDAREIECAVLGNENPEASVPGEVIVADEFYSFEDKYIAGKSKTEVPAKISREQAKRIQELSVKAFTALGCEGMARVDFFIDRSSGSVYLNELNTIPGFTSISMYPKLWEASGLPYPKLLERLIELALERHKRQLQLKTNFQSQSDWYKK